MVSLALVVIHACSFRFAWKSCKVISYMLQEPAFILYLCYEAPPCLYPNNLIVDQDRGHLYIFSLWIDAAYEIHFCFIYVPVRVMIQEVTKSKNAKFLFQQFSTLWPHAFEVFDGTCQYIGYRRDKNFCTKISAVNAFVRNSELYSITLLIHYPAK